MCHSTLNSSLVACYIALLNYMQDVQFFHPNSELHVFDDCFAVFYGLVSDYLMIRRVRKQLLIPLCKSNKVDDRDAMLTRLSCWWQLVLRLGPYIVSLFTEVRPAVMQILKNHLCFLMLGDANWSMLPHKQRYLCSSKLFLACLDLKLKCQSFWLNNIDILDLTTWVWEFFAYYVRFTLYCGIKATFVLTIFDLFSSFVGV